MNRRQLLKNGTALMSLAMVNRVERTFGTVNAQNSGTLSILFHGLSLLIFARDGSKADVSWLAFEREARSCDVPIHLPVLRILNPGSTKCLTKPNERLWSMAGLSIAPADIAASAPLQAPTYRDEATIPLDHPRQNADWESLKWVPLLKGPIDEDQLRRLMIASVSLTAGSLRGYAPRSPDAHLMLWSLVSNRRKSDVGRLPRQALTDQILYSVPFSGSVVKLRFTPIVGGPGFDFEFQSSSGQVELGLEADAALPGEYGPIQPVRNYCAYYQIVTPKPEIDDRALPYARGRFQMNGGPALASTFPLLDRMPPLSATQSTREKKGSPGATSPDPFCGSGRFIR